MNKRNLVWLVVIVVVAVVVGLSRGLIWSLIAGGIVLVVSEIIERIRRSRRALAAGTVAPSLRDAIPTRRNKR